MAIKKRMFPTTMIALLLAGVFTLVCEVQSTQGEQILGVRVGDWIILNQTVAYTPSPGPIPRWTKLEFLSVEGTTLSVKTTTHKSDGTEQNGTFTLDTETGYASPNTYSGLVIPASSKPGDAVYVGGAGSTTIAGEETRTYAGVSRTVLRAAISTTNIASVFYYDKLTGVLVESSGTWSGLTMTMKATETNMWQASVFGIQVEPWQLYVLAALAIIAVVGVSSFIILKKRASKKVATPTAVPPPPPPT